MAKKITEESLRLNIIVNGDQGRKALLDLEKTVSSNTQKLSQLKAEMSKLEAQGKTSGKEYDRLKGSIAKETQTLESNRQKLDALKRQQSVNTMTMAELRKHVNLTRTALAHAIPGTENWKRLNNELQESRTRLKQLETQAQATEGIIAKFTKGWSDVWALSQVVSDVSQRIGDFVSRTTDAYVEYDAAIANAMKTTNLSREEVAALGEEFKRMDTRTAQNELMALLRIGGKLGISGQEDLLGFVRAADKINVALSEDLGGNAEDAIAAIGKMTDIFDLASVYGQEEAMLKIASAVNSLGMASTANEGYIVDFTKRMAGIAPNADISIDKILGLAATLDKYGQTSEVSATSIGQTIVAMYKKTETFANIARMSFGEFKQLLDTDVNEALLRVAEGMKGATDGGFAPIVEAMDGMGLNGQRAVTVLGTLAKNSEEVRSQQALANQAFSDGSSVIEEFNVQNETLEASLEKTNKKIEEQTLIIGQQLMPVRLKAAELAEMGWSVLSKLVAVLLKYKVEAIALAAVIVATYNAQKIYNGVLVAGKKIKRAWLLLTRQETVSLRAQIASMKGASASTALFSAAKMLLCGNIKAATVAMRAFSAAIKANPAGLIVAGITAAVGALIHFISKSRESTKALRELNEQTAKTSDGYSEAAAKIKDERRALEELKAAVLNANIGSNERARAIKAINDRYSEYLPNLLTEKSSNEDVETALKGVNDELERKILLQAKEQELVKVQQHRTDAIKAIVTDANTLSEQKRGKRLSAAETKRLTEAAVKYYDSRLSGDGDAFFGDALPALSSALASTGGTPKRIEKIREAFNDAIASGAELKSLVDGLFGEEDPSSDSPAGKVSVGGTGGDVVGSGDGSSSVSGGEWSLNNDEAYLEAALALKKKYASGEIETEKELNERILQLEIDTLKKRLEIAEGDEILSVDSQLQDKLIQQKNARIKAEEEVVKTEAQLQLEQLNERESRARAAHELAMLELQNRHNQELAAAEANGEDMKALKERQAQERTDVELKYIQELGNIINELTGDSNTINLSVDGTADQQLVALQAKLQELIALKNRLEGKEAVNYSGGSGKETESSENSDEGSKWDGFGGSDLFGVNTQQWDELIQKMADGKMAADDWATAIQGIGGMADYAMGIASKWADNQTKQEQKQLKEYEKANDKKKKALEKRLDAGLMSEAQYNAECEKLDAEYEAYQEELALKQAKREKQMSLTQAIINTAMSVTKALATNPWPLSLVVAGINAAMGAAEIALIASQPVTTGYEDGGLTAVTRKQDGRTFKARLSPDRGLVDQPTVLVGENGSEYVVPHEGLENPTLAPFLGTIETARRNGTLKNLDFGAVYSPAFTAFGRAAGGFTAGDGLPSAAVAGNQQVVVVLDDETKSLLKEIREKQDEPTPAIVSMLGKNGLKEKMEEYERLRKRGRL